MVFKDILVNYSRSSKERMAFLIEKLEKLEENESIIFVGDTFYTNDLNLSYFVEFINLLNQYKEHKIFIQDVESLSAKLTRVEVRSWYRLPTWPNHVTLYHTTQEINISADELRAGFTYKEDKDQQLNTDEELLRNEEVRKFNGFTQEEKQVYLNKVNRLYERHKNDLVGAFIDEVKKKEYNFTKEATIIHLGVDALLRR